MIVKAASTTDGSSRGALHSLGKRRGLRPTARDLRCKASHSSGDQNDSLGLSTLFSRVSELRVAESTRDAVAANNWRDGKCSSRVIAALEDVYIRGLRFSDCDIVGGTHIGQVFAIQNGSDYGGEEDYVSDGEGQYSLGDCPHDEEVTSIDFDGIRFTTGSADGTVKVWSFPGCECTVTLRLPGEISNVRLSYGFLCFSSNSGAVGAAPVDELEISAKQDEPASYLGKWKVLDVGVTSLDASKYYLFAGCADGWVRVFKKKNLSEILKVRAHKQEVTSVCYHEDSDIMFTGSSLGSIKAWSMDSGREIAELDGHNNAIMDLQADSKKLLSGSTDGTIRAWCLDTMEIMFEMEGFTPYLRSLQFDRERLISDGCNNLIIEHFFGTDDDTEDEDGYDI